MSKRQTNANAEFEDNAPETMDIPQGGDTVDNSYAGKDGGPVPVLKDEEPVEQPDERDPDSDKALERDEADAIDKSNILKGDRLRHAKPTNTYREPGDEEGLPKGNDGTSAARAPGAEGAYDNVIGGGEGTGIEGNDL